jgi:hypothetical protein
VEPPFGIEPMTYALRACHVRCSHYLLTEGQRDRAVELGAQVITAREADKMERQRAAVRGESQF